MMNTLKATGVELAYEEAHRALFWKKFDAPTIPAASDDRSPRSLSPATAARGLRA
jgi:hypothetical protein